HRGIAAAVCGGNPHIQLACEGWPRICASQTQSRWHVRRAGSHRRMKTPASIGALRLRRILETSLYADDLDQAEAFYKSELGPNLFAREAGRHLFFKFGDQMLLIFNPAKTIEESGVAPHGAHGPGHVAFTVPMSEMDGWK